MQMLIKDAVIIKGRAYCGACFKNRRETSFSLDALYRAFSFLDDTEILYCNRCNTDLSRES